MGCGQELVGGDECTGAPALTSNIPRMRNRGLQKFGKVRVPLYLGGGRLAVRYEFYVWAQSAIVELDILPIDLRTTNRHDAVELALTTCLSASRFPFCSRPALYESLRISKNLPRLCHSEIWQASSSHLFLALC